MKKLIMPIFIILLSACAAPKSSNPALIAETKPTDGKTLKTSTKIPIDIKECICIQLWLPVCGENGKTYSNACFAKCARVKYTQGACSKEIKD